jgi:2-deoxy-D-gluconate 3-dehydrogenase
MMAAVKRRMLMDLFDLSGRVAIVTGGNGGIGLGMATGLAKAGSAVVIAGRNAEKNAAAVRELEQLGAEVAAAEGDLTSEADCRNVVASAVQRFGRLDILVNNAGINIRKRPEEYSLEEWRLVLETNLTSAFACSQAAYPELQKAGGGKIINIGSMMSIFGASFTAPYAASKGGIVQMTKALACAWARDNIQVNAVLPGWIDTALTRQARTQIANLHEGVEKRTPAGRWGVPGDFAGIAVFLAAPASDFVTGTAIPVDGGYSVQGAV